MVTGLIASWHVGSSLTRDQTRMPCIGRWILNHWTPREVLFWGLCHHQKPVSHPNCCLGCPILSLTGSPSQVEEAEDTSPGILLLVPTFIPSLPDYHSTICLHLLSPLFLPSLVHTLPGHPCWGRGRGKDGKIRSKHLPFPTQGQGWGDCPCSLGGCAWGE